MGQLIKYRTTATVTLGPGAVLGLTAQQAAARAYALQQVDDGVYRAEQPVQFKAGEQFGYEGPLPKALADDLEEVAEREAKGKAKAAEKAA